MCEGCSDFIKEVKKLYDETKDQAPIHGNPVNPSLEIRKNTFGEFVIYEGQTYSVCKKPYEWFYRYGPYENLS